MEGQQEQEQEQEHKKKEEEKWENVVFSVEAPGAVLNFQILLGTESAFCYVGTSDPSTFNRLAVCTKARSRDSTFKYASSNPLGGDAKTGAQSFAERLLDLVHTEIENRGKELNLNSIAVSVNVADDASTLRAFAEKTLAKRLLEMLR
jgi:hypothetical protein|tara:strand:- start:186 stop:629 length:444 start_codon:yes stop_codon:yes gene_type:complete